MLIQSKNHCLSRRDRKISLLKTYHRRTLEPTKKRYPMCKDKGEATTRQQEGCNHNKSKAHTRQVGAPTGDLSLL